jgi:hypothetical protein
MVVLIKSSLGHHKLDPQQLLQSKIHLDMLEYLQIIATNKVAHNIFSPLEDLSKVETRLKTHHSY